MEKKTTVRLTPVDQRNAKRLIQYGYASTLTGAIRHALAVAVKEAGWQR